MKTITITISKNQYLIDVLTILETNTIYYKTITNIGATTAEILAPRNSIIIEPNVPVIKGKRAKGILGVYEGITVDRIIEYLMSNVKHKKIIITPESFFKVKEAAAFLKINLFQDYFLLFDECDRVIKDSGFRTAITLPMDDFFKFAGKAFISATVIDPTDPRFIEQNFSKVIIEPDFSYQKDINLVITNNIFHSLKKVLNENKSSNYCIFINSTKLIGAYIKKLEIQDESAIFCSRDSSYKFRIANFKNVSEGLKDFNPFNFLTSRFYSAVDIYMDERPTIIMVTDLVTASHSMIDPFTDAIQIVGRFRKGFDKIIHITNLDPDMKTMNKDEVFAYLSGCEMTYNQIKALRQGATTAGAIDTLDEVLKLIPYAQYLNVDGSKNYFMQDNRLHEEIIKQCYKSSDNFLKAYTNKHFKPSLVMESYPLDDKSNANLSSGMSLLTIVKEIIQALDWIFDTSMPYSIDNRNTVLAELNKCFPLIVHAYKELGAIDLERNGYSIKQIKKALRYKSNTKAKSNFEFIKSIQEHFEVQESYSDQESTNILRNIINEHKLVLKANRKLLEEYFDLSPRKTIRRLFDKSEVKGFTILRSKFNK